MTVRPRTRSSALIRSVKSNFFMIPTRSLFGGALVGAFLVGMLVPRVNGWGAFLGMLTGFAGVAWLS